MRSFRYKVYEIKFFDKGSSYIFCNLIMWKRRYEIRLIIFCNITLKTFSFLLKTWKFINTSKNYHTLRRAHPPRKQNHISTLFPADRAHCQPTRNLNPPHTQIHTYIAGVITRNENTRPHQLSRCSLAASVRQSSSLILSSSAIDATQYHPSQMTLHMYPPHDNYIIIPRI